jgi:hypothetical protein
VKRAILKPDAIPSQFDWTIVKKVRKPPAKRHIDEPEPEAAESHVAKRQCNNETHEDVQQESSAENQLVEHPGSIVPENFGSVEQHYTCATKHVTDHDYNNEPVSIDLQLVAARQRIEELESEVNILQMSKFGIERFSNNSKLIRFYTGFPSYECMKNFYSCIVSHTLVMRT